MAIFGRFSGNFVKFMDLPGRVPWLKLNDSGRSWNTQKWPFLGVKFNPVDGCRFFDVKFYQNHQKITIFEEIFRKRGFQIVNLVNFQCLIYRGSDRFGEIEWF